MNYMLEPPEKCMPHRAKVICKFCDRSHVIDPVDEDFYETVQVIDYDSDGAECFDICEDCQKLGITLDNVDRVTDCEKCNGYAIDGVLCDKCKRGNKC